MRIRRRDKHIHIARPWNQLRGGRAPRARFPWSSDVDMLVPPPNPHNPPPTSGW